MDGFVRVGVSLTVLLPFLYFIETVLIGVFLMNEYSVLVHEMQETLVHRDYFGVMTEMPELLDPLGSVIDIQIHLHIIYI